MLEAIFYARFHPERGPSIIHQYPKNAVVSRSQSDHLPFKFSDISSYVIPPYELCDRPLSICTNGFRILGFPVSLENAMYARNRFTFNVCFVLAESEDPKPWTQVVRKTALFFRTLEEEDGILQAEELLGGLKWAGEEGYPATDTGAVHALLESILVHLTDYGETCIRIDDVHVLTLRLQQSRPAPFHVQAWDVPLLVRPLPASDEWTWDLTLQQVYTHIDGVNHVQRIAELADVEPKLVKKVVQDLLHHERVILLDLFHFQAIYAPNHDLAWFTKDDAMQDECCRYVEVDAAKNIFSKSVVEQTASQAPTKRSIVELYRDLGPGPTLKAFCLSNQVKLHSIDVRRLITFGVLKGFLRRIHKYALAVEPRSTPPESRLSDASSASKQKSNEDVERAWKKAALSSGWPTPPMQTLPEDASRSLDGVGSAGDELIAQDDELKAFLNGKHCMDEICVALHCSERKVLERLRSGKFGEIVLFSK